MTRRVSLPSERDVRFALAELAAADHYPTVVALARCLGLTNATFWRHFPEIAQEVADARRRALRAAPAEDAPPGNAEATAPKAETSRLRTENTRLREQLDTAVSHIQHLTLENQALASENRALREDLELAAKVTRIPRP